MGNLRSVEKAFAKLGYPANICNTADVLRGSDAIVLPGVGAFGRAMEALKAKSLDLAIQRHIQLGKPFLGICLGLQLLFTESEEFGRQEGLGVLKGKVVRFAGQQFERAGPDSPAPLRVPHMGWNAIRKVKETPLLADTPDGSMFYFVHSYFPVPDDRATIAAVTDHGGYFCSAVQQENVFACQFHPEKSGPVGLAILDKFGEQVYGPVTKPPEPEEMWFQPRPPQPKPRPRW